MATPLAATLSNAIHDLELLLHPKPSEGYIVRFGFQVGLNSILFVLCIIYLVFTYIENKRVGRPLALFKVQRVASGRFIVVNALVLLVLFDAIAAVLMLALRYKLYIIYYGTASTRNQLVLNVQGWSPLTLVAWAYSFGNIAAMMQIKTRDYGGPSARAVMSYNVAFFSTLIVAFGLGLPFCIIANARMNTLVDNAEQLLPILRSVDLTNITTISPTTSRMIQSLRNEIASCQRDAIFWTRGVLVLAGGISCLTAISAGAALWFVAFLLRFPNTPSAESSGRRSHILTTVNEESTNEDQEITFLGLGDPNEVPELRSLRKPKSSKRPSTGGSAPTGNLTTAIAAARSTNVSLKRLSRDLTLSVPVVGVLSLYCMALAILTGIHLGDHTFAWREVMYDGVSWSSIVLIFVVGSFLYNLLKYRHSNPPPSPSQAVPLVNSKSGHLQLHSPPLSPLSPMHQQQQVHSQHRRPKIVSVGSGRYALGQEDQHLDESDIDYDKKEGDMYATEEGVNTDRKYERFANVNVPRTEGRDNEVAPFQWAVTPKMGSKGRR